MEWRTNNMIDKIEELLENIKLDYAKQCKVENVNFSDHVKGMIERFNDGLGYKVGPKYIKITTDNHGSAWGFIVKNDFKHFKRGDILKASSWHQPALNQARGNIFETYNIQWTGPRYLN
jgi:hypothetical protein